MESFVKEIVAFYDIAMSLICTATCISASQDKSFKYTVSSSITVIDFCHFKIWNVSICILGNEDVHLHLLDMSNSKKVLEFASEFKQSGKSLNVLVNNAGCMVNERTVNEYNLEVNFATNTFGTYILTESLMELLKTQENPQVITVTSGKDIRCSEYASQRLNTLHNDSK